MLRRLRRFAVPTDLPTDLTISPVCRVVRNRVEGQWVQFCVVDPADTIQREHLKGQFYEPEELAIIRRYMPRDAVFCDIGANIGNHTLYVLKYLDVKRSILFEPNPDAISLLTTNIAVNGIKDRCDLSNLGFGLGDQDAAGFDFDTPDRNLGGTRLVDDGGAIEVRRGDDLLGDQPIDFIKLDVEGMELKVLDGLKRVIARNRPTLFIEVDKENADTFQTWVKANDYEIRERFQRYEENENFLLTCKRS